MIACALIAATILPESTYPLFFSLLIGTYFAAWLSYWFGRLLGPKLSRLPYIRAIATPTKLKRMETFYKRRGFVTLLLGRFVPFGIRNCLFMSTGMSRFSFPRFAVRDAIACTIWASTMFTIFYHLGANLDRLIHFAKTFNIIIFALFGVTLITVIWYKKRKRAKQDDQPVE